MEYDKGEIRNVIDKAVRRDGNAKPSFYAITGSHIYGFPSEEGGDVDVRGFHIVENEEYLKIDGPKEQFKVNQGNVTHGFEQWEDIDLVSYELKKFVSLLYTANYNVIELIFDGREVINGVPLEIESLRSLIKKNLPIDVPHTYLGMAKSNYWKYLNPEKESYRPTAKKFLYVLRGLYGAEYVTSYESIEPNIFNLADHAGGDRELIEELVEIKLSGKNKKVSNELSRKSREEITTLFNEIDPPSNIDKRGYKEDLNDWMLKVRT